MTVLGIFGSIASGKSTARRFFEKRGFFGIDADAIVRELYEASGVGTTAIAELFGKFFLNEEGSVDRKKLLAFLVKNPDRLSDVHRVIHPLVTARIREILADLEPSRRVVLESVYFDSSHLGQFVDFLLEISAPRDACFERAFVRGLSKTAFDFFWNRSPNYQADFSVVNDGNLDKFEEKLSELFKVSRKRYFRKRWWRF